ncbi:hypothetical protein [Salibacterium aidingense]|uniref:hypothetical protein n=1 Tax=Salibacterium aidingense TaxID=384933 RepID=UPI003BC2A2EB
MTVATQEELEDAMEAEVINITLDETITLDPVEFEYLGNLDLGSETLEGDVFYDTEDAGTLTLKNGTIDGNVTVDAPNATVNNSASVEGTTTINDVDDSTWNEKTDGNELVVDDENAKVNIEGDVDRITITAAAEVNIDPEKGAVSSFTANGDVDVTGSENIDSAEINADGVTFDGDTVDEEVLALFSLNNAFETDPAGDNDEELKQAVQTELEKNDDVFGIDIASDAYTVLDKSTEDHPEWNRQWDVAHGVYDHAVRVHEGSYDDTADVQAAFNQAVSYQTALDNISSYVDPSGILSEEDAMELRQAFADIMEFNEAEDDPDHAIHRDFVTALDAYEEDSHGTGLQNQLNGTDGDYSHTSRNDVLEALAHVLIEEDTLGYGDFETIEE